MEIIGAGFGRTGTSSLKIALEQLGYAKCYHMTELLEHPEQVKYWQQLDAEGTTDFDSLFEGYRATVDFPGYRFYKQLHQAYPEAKVILSTRDFDAWYRSTANTIYQAGSGLLKKVLLGLQLPFSSRHRKLLQVFKLADKTIWKDEFAGKFEDKAFAKKVFDQHHADVIKTISADKLLVFDAKEGWKPLCRFLGKDVPDQPYPHVNQQAEFRKKTKRIK